MCPDCIARSQLLRAALLDARIKDALIHAAKGAAEMAGLKDKTGVAERDALKDSGAAG